VERAGCDDGGRSRLPGGPDVKPAAEAPKPGRTMTTGSVSHRRADTRRNHERILAVAAESLARCGEVSYNAIVKLAEVGVTVLRGLGGLMYLDPDGVWRSQTESLTDLIWRGMHA